MSSSGFTVSEKHKEKMKANKYLDLTGELKKKIKNKKMTVIPNIVASIEMVPKGLEKRLEKLEIRRRIETI